jgi:quercetin dioxygenase-like cupin family protein
MAHAGQILENPISGEKIIFRQTAADTERELLAFELVLAPGGGVPGAHVHPEQEERFEVVSGTMAFRVGLKRIVAGPGEAVVVPAGRMHRFENAGDEAAHVLVEVRPALEMERLFETVVSLAGEGRCMRSGMPKPLDLALFVREFRREVRAPFPPPLAVRAALAPLAWVAERRGRELGRAELTPSFA